MRKFKEQKELIQFARNFIEDRLNALSKDTQHCLKEPYAPFPSILLCFSTIDMLGALYAGDASKKARTTEQSKRYMKRFMSYTNEQCEMLMEIFRHKIIHLAQPKAIIEYKGKKVTWRYWHDNKISHLKLTKLKEKVDISVSSNWALTAEYEFAISIIHLVQDIENSVFDSEGYFHSLKTCVDIQDSFEKAISEIYE
ncbi:hypothetical protein [Desulfosudis oleivorans]|nr:hypothetical protein [Desulfosudis oleivorans]